MYEDVESAVPPSLQSKERRSYLPTLSLAERDRRWRAVRDAMAFQGIDCLMLVGNDLHQSMAMANFRYLTHIGSRKGGYCVFPLEGEPAVFTGAPHFNWPYSIYSAIQDWIPDIRTDAGIPGVVEELKARGCEGGSVGIVGFGSTYWRSSIGYTDYVRLQQLLPRARLVEASGLVDQVRSIKSAEEIEMMKRAGELANKMVVAMRESSRPGKLECEVWADMLHAAISNGGEPTLFNLLASGPAEGDPAQGLEHLLHGSEYPAAPSMRPLRKGDLVITELHACWGGYLAAAEYSVFVGEAPDPLRRIHEVAVECFYGGVEKMRPGTTVDELVEAFRAPCARAGMDFIELGFHGHGLASPEMPTVTYKSGLPLISGQGIGHMEIKENMVFGTNIDIFDPRWRPDVGIMLGDMMHVTKEGARSMCNIPMEFPQNPA